MLFVTDTSVLKGRCSILVHNIFLWLKTLEKHGQFSLLKEDFHLKLSVGIQDTWQRWPRADKGSEFVSLGAFNHSAIRPYPPNSSLSIITNSKHMFDISQYTCVGVFGEFTSWWRLMEELGSRFLLIQWWVTLAASPEVTSLFSNGDHSTLQQGHKQNTVWQDQGWQKCL